MSQTLLSIFQILLIKIFFTKKCNHYIILLLVLHEKSLVDKREGAEQMKRGEKRDQDFVFIIGWISVMREFYCSFIKMKTKWQFGPHPCARDLLHKTRPTHISRVRDFHNF